MKIKLSFAGIIILLITSIPTSFCQTIDSATAKAFVPGDLRTNNKILLVKINEYKKNKVKECKSQFRKNYDGLFEIVPANVSMDNAYPDLNIYKYVLVIGGSLSQEDFNGISNKEVFFDKTDSSFTHRGSSLFIFDRSSDHDLYETGVPDITKASVTGYSFKQPQGLGSISNRSYHVDYGAINYNLIKVYIRILNSY